MDTNRPINSVALPLPSSRTARSVARPRLAGELLAHAVLLLGILLATVAAYNYPRTLRLDADSNVRAAFGNMYDVERNEQLAYRWTDGQGRVCMEQVGVAALAGVSVTLLGEGAVPLGVEQAGIRANGVPLATVTLAPQRRAYQLLVDGRKLRGDSLCTSIISAAARAPDDPRDLGVPFASLSLMRFADLGPVQPPLGQTLLNLAAGLLIFWGLRRLGLNLWLAMLAVALAAGGIAAALAAGALTSGFELARAMVPLIGVGALLVAGGLGARFVWPSVRSRAGWTAHPLFRDLVGMLFWSCVLYTGVRLLQEAQNRHGVFPLKAGVWPGFTAMVLAPVLLFVGWLALVVRQLRSERPSLVSGALLVWLGGLVMPVALKVFVRGSDLLYLTFRDNPTDYIHDVPRVGAPLTFLGQFVEISPTLAWHSANHPPGAVLLLWAIDRIVGPGPYVATWTIILIGSTATLVAFWLGLRVGGPHIALLAGAIFAMMPGFQHYNVTSMDSVFNLLMGATAATVWVTMEGERRPGLAVLAGVLAALGLLFTYAATQLAIWGAVVCVLALLRGRSLRSVAQHAALAVATFVAIYGLLYLASGFNIVEAVLQGAANNGRLVQRSAVSSNLGHLAPPSITYYVYFLGVNILPYGWYLAPWGLTAIAGLVLAGGRALPRPGAVESLALSLLALVAGMWISGLFIAEVERIWGYTYPVAAVLIACYAWRGGRPSPLTPLPQGERGTEAAGAALPVQRERLWRAGLFITLFFGQCAIMRQLLNTYW